MQKQTSISLKGFVKKADLKGYVSLNRKLVLLLPYIAVAAFLIVLPMIMLLTKALSPMDSDLQTNLDVMTPSVWKSMGRSVYLGLIAAFASLILAFPFAYIVGRSKSKAFRLVSVALIVSPLLVFTIARTFSLKILLMQMFDNESQMRNEVVMVIGMVYLYMPFMIVPLYSVLQQMPASLVEASKDLGYGRLTSIIKVVFPYALKAIFSGLAVVFMMSATSLAISGALLKGDSEHVMIGNQIDGMSANMTSDLAANTHNYIVQGSTLALITIGIMFGVYIVIYAIPQIIKKIKGGVNA